MIRVLLPFNESTSSSDQANVNNNKTDIDVSSIPYGVIDKYRPYAITLRSTIRVKMADAEDLKQVLDLYSFAIVQSFLFRDNTGEKSDRTFKIIL